MDLVGSSVVWAPWWCSSTATVLDGGRLGVGARGSERGTEYPLSEYWLAGTSWLEVVAALCCACTEEVSGGHQAAAVVEQSV